MKFFTFISLIIFSHTLYASGFGLDIAYDIEKVGLALKQENEIIVNTPKGTTAGILIKKLDNVAIVAYSKDFARGLANNDLSVTTKTIQKISEKFIPVEYSYTNEKFGYVVVIDSKDLLGKEIAGLKLNLKSATVGGTDVSPTKLPVKKYSNYMIVGEVKVGGFIGATGPDGLAHKEKYTIEKNCNLGALIIYNNDKALGCSHSMENGSSKVGTLDMPENVDQVELLLNDKKTSDNDGKFTIIYNP